jgi:hypothetical protein
MNLVTPKAGAKHVLLFNKPASRLLHIQSGLKCDQIQHDSHKFNHT